MLLKKFQCASRPPDRDFLLFGEEVWSFGKFREEVRRAAEWLAGEGVRAGTVLAVCGTYSPRAVALLFAAAELRTVAVPVTELPGGVRDERFRAAGVEGVVEKLKVKSEKDEGEGYQGSFKVQGSRFKVGDARERFKVHRSKFNVDGEERSESLSRLSSSKATEESARHPLVAQLARAGRPGLVLFSSGTTGTPKAMLHDLGNLVDGYSVKAGPGPRTLAFLHHDHIGGLDILFRAASSGAALVIPEDRDPESVARLIERHRIEVLPASPTFLNLLLLSGAAEAHDLSSLTIIGYGSEPMPEALLRRLRTAFPDVRFQQKFGTSETNAVRMVSRSPDSLEMRVEDPRVEWKVVEGELWLKSPSRILGYLNAGSEALTDDGWYRTGDLVEETGDGYFRIVGRRSDVINVGGEKVFPSEVENVLAEMPEVRECRVFGESHPVTGAVVAVEVVPADDVSVSELKKAIRKFCRERLESYKIPVKVYRAEKIEIGDSFKKRREEA